MKRDKYMGMDVHQATTVVAVIDVEGKIGLETIVPTAAGPIRRLIEGITGPVHVTLEETTQAEWLHDLLEGFVAEVVVCDPRRNKLLVEGSKGDKADARKLAELLRTGMVRSVWHGRKTTRGLKEVVRAYETFAVDTEGHRHKAIELLRTIPRIGPIRAAQIVASAGTPHRFRTKRQFWSYSGLAVVTHTSAEYEMHTRE
jgi:transposase